MKLVCLTNGLADNYNVCWECVETQSTQGPRYDMITAITLKDHVSNSLVFLNTLRETNTNPTDIQDGPSTDVAI